MFVLISRMINDPLMRSWGLGLSRSLSSCDVLVSAIRPKEAWSVKEIPKISSQFMRCDNCKKEKNN